MTIGKRRVKLLVYGISMSAVGEHLAELARQVRGDTLRLLAAAPPSWLTWAPPGTSNHILWHAGHALWLQDVLFIELVTGRSELPEGWAETFGMNCRPVRVTNEQGGWPPRQEVERRLVEQLGRVLELLALVPEKELEARARAIGRRSLASSAIHGWHDEAKHQGEMYLLLKMQRGQRRSMTEHP